MTTALVISLFIGIIVSIPRIRAVIQVLFSSPIEDNMQSPRIPEKLAGKVVENVTTSPLSKQPCAFWSVKVSESGSKRNSVLFKKSSTDAFFIKKDGAEIRIEPEGADYLFNEQQTNLWTNGFAGNPFNYKKVDKELLDNVRSMGASFNEFTEGLGIKIEETVFAAGDKLFVNGKMKEVKGIKTIRQDHDGLLIISNWSETEYIWKQIGWITLQVLIGEIAGYMFYIALSKR